MVKESKKKNATTASRKWLDVGSFGAVVLGLVLLNIIGSAFFFRLDLTADKRFSILPATKALLGSLPERSEERRVGKEC